MSKTKKIKTAVGVADRTDPYYALGSSRVESDKFWRWGDDNLFPAALALMARRSTTHRRIINDKADYISGKGFTCDEAQQPQLAAFVRCVNGRGESLRQVLGKLAFDKSLFGNAFLEAVTDPRAQCRHRPKPTRQQVRGGWLGQDLHDFLPLGDSQLGSIQVPQLEVMDGRQPTLPKVPLPLIDRGGLTSDNASNEINACTFGEHEHCRLFVIQRGLVVLA